MAVGIVVCSLPPFLADWLKKPNWTITHPDPVLLDLDIDDSAEETAEPEQQVLHVHASAAANHLTRQ